MKQLQKSDLKKGEIYVSNRNGKTIFKYLDLNGPNNPNVRISFFRGGATVKFGLNDIVDATQEEKHWLKECIKADKFVSYEEAMKTFIPEYVECIEENVYDYGTNVIGKIYKVFGVTPNHINPDYLIEYGGIKHLSVSKHRFKPSTKEAYEAQFKEPEFVLPEIWWVRITQENLEDVTTFLGFKFYERAIGKIVGMVKHYHTGEIQKGWNATPTTIYGSTFGDEITTEQFRKYVLKKQDENISKFINDKTVINKEGEVFKVGDVIKSTNGTLKDKIISFRWKNDKSEICAVLPNIPNGIGIDKIELYIEPKVEPKQELSLLEQAKLKYPVGTKYKNAFRKRGDAERIFTVENEIKHFHKRIGIHTDNQWLYYEGQWAEIVEDFVLPEKWCIKDVKEVKEFFENYNHGNYTCGNNAYLHYPKIINYCYFEEIQKDYTEITLEQFKKYVLNEKV